MIISRTPFRISFFGGGTDYPVWFKEHGGAVLATTINKYCYLHCRFLPPFFEHKFHAVYSKIERTKNIDEIMHPAIRETLRYLEIGRGLSILYDADIPSKSGMGSSSSFLVGLLHALSVLRGKKPARKWLAKESINIERGILKETGGFQDQILAAYGGFNIIEFLPNGEFRIERLALPARRKRELNDRLMLFYTGIPRTAAEVADRYVSGLLKKRQELMRTQELVHLGVTILKDGGDINRFGELLHEGWMTKRSLSSHVSNSIIDEVYKKARGAGAIGGKLLGAGGGGFILFFVPPERKADVRKELKHLTYVPFLFEPSGSKIIGSHLEEDYADIEEF
ncbi:kinase [Candidatus Roizmanbacteria bacterium]|nr:kinase [Candidatus Roizmanbacteria bacterium]